MNAEIIKWKIPEGFENLPEVVNRNEYTDRLSELDVNEISKKCLTLNLDEVKHLFRQVVSELPEGKLSGVGIDLGAGTGFLSVMAISEFPSINKIYAIEIVDGYPKKIMPKVASELLKKDASKVIPVIGSFDEIELPDNSVDFAIEIHSLHHSHDLDKTLKEVHRVLKPGGLLVCFDRSHPDSLTNEERENMVNRVYTKEFLKKNGYPEDITLTRKDNGEHEHRISEWKTFFTNNGFSVSSIKYVLKPFNAKMFLVNSLSFLPDSLCKLIFGKKAKKIKRLNFDKQWLKIMGKLKGNVTTFKRDYTIFVCVNKKEND